MKIDKHTLYRDFAPVEPYVEPSTHDELRRASVVERYGEGGFYEMTLGDFLDAAEHDDISVLQDCNGETVFDVYRATAFSLWVNELIALLEGYNIKPTAKQVAAAGACKTISFEESVYFFCREYFGLQNFDDVRKLKVVDYILARKETYNRLMMERNLLK